MGLSTIRWQRCLITAGGWWFWLSVVGGRLCLVGGNAVLFLVTDRVPQAGEQALIVHQLFAFFAAVGIKLRAQLRQLRLIGVYFLQSILLGGLLAYYQLFDSLDVFSAILN